MNWYGSHDPWGQVRALILALSLVVVLLRLVVALARQGDKRCVSRGQATAEPVTAADSADVPIRDASVWWICAAADGFVVASLYVARRADGSCSPDSGRVS